MTSSEFLASSTAQKCAQRSTFFQFSTSQPLSFMLCARCPHPKPYPRPLPRTYPLPNSAQPGAGVSWAVMPEACFQHDGRELRLLSTLVPSARLERCGAALLGGWAKQPNACTVEVRTRGFASVEVRIAEAPDHPGAEFRSVSSGGAASCRRQAIRPHPRILPTA